SIWFKASQPEPTPKIDGDRQRHHRPRAALRRGLRARPPTPTVGTQPMDLEPNAPENDKGERLVTSENRLDGAIDSAKIRQQVRAVFDL
ncbi:hypothetical protein, partial [Aestuariivirga sp.]|uniref:hypothetical protein n=1 Tax=Aestuariivirga sp. TaxID=2650926 RepID=UPI00359403CC